ncbi:MAG: pentapeptide repeat-containing protein [Caulobacteraceae bacterium]|nr:MAG: pentapeptide repeat-containing protein [Caulobacteraceae bacterium]
MGPLLLGPDRLLPCDLSNAVIKGADLTDADLRHAVLVSADLTRSNFTNALLKNADLTAAHREGAKGLDTAE